MKLNNILSEENLNSSRLLKAEEGDLQQELVLKAARDRGIKITDISKQMLCRSAILELDGQVELLVKGIISSSMNLKTKYICDFKQLTKNIFSILDIPSPKSLIFFEPNDCELEGFIESGKNYVCKPQVAANGLGVEINIKSYEQIKSYFIKNSKIDTAFLLEEQVEGEDLRIQVIGGRIVASCIRVPAYVVGDGVNTLINLIEIRREVIHSQCPSDSLILDEDSFELIKKQNLSLESIPSKGEKITLKNVANIGQGGIAIDVSNEIHSDYENWVNKIVNLCNADYFALDVICKDHTKDPIKNSFALEINSLAEWTHHTFSERRTHDLGKTVIDATFGLQV